MVLSRTAAQPATSPYAGERRTLSVLRVEEGIWEWLVEDGREGQHWWSPRLYELLGYQDQEIRATSEALAGLVHPQDEQEYRRAAAACLDGLPLELEIRLRKTSGEYRWFRMHGAIAHSEQDSGSRIVGTLTDIHGERDASSELARTKKFLEKVTTIVPSIIYVFNQVTMSNEYVNRSLAASVGYSEAEVQELGGELMPKLMHPEDLPKILAHFERIRHLKDGELAELEYRMKRKDGSYAWLLSIDTVFERDEDGGVLRHIGVATDVSKLKQAQKQLQQTNNVLEQRVQERTQELAMLNRELERRVKDRTRELSRTNKELEELAYATTHDMKTPINTIFSYLGFLRDDEQITSKLSLDAIHWMGKAVEQAQQKIADLMAVARVRNDTDRTDEILCIRSVVDAARAGLQAEISESDAVIEQDFSRAETVRFPRPQATSIIENLLTNAIRYRDPGRPLRIRLQTEKRGDFVCLSIADNGIGIDLARDGEKIFGLFKRAHKSVPGSGVGLYISQQAIERADGRIEVDSRLGEGSVFRVYFKNVEGTAQEN